MFLVKNYAYWIKLKVNLRLTNNNQLKRGHSLSREIAPVEAETDAAASSLITIDQWKKHVIVRDPSSILHSSPIKVMSSLHNHTASYRRFTFDSVFGVDDSQLEMSSHIMLGDGILMHVLAGGGRDACVFTFGTNRKGKTPQNTSQHRVNWA